MIGRLRPPPGAAAAAAVVFVVVGNTGIVGQGQIDSPLVVVVPVRHVVPAIIVSKKTRRLVHAGVNNLGGQAEKT